MAVNLNKLKTSGRLVFNFLQTHTHNTYTHTHTHRKQEKTQEKGRKETIKMEKGDFFVQILW